MKIFSRPPHLPSWSIWRSYHAKVWKQTVKARWSSLAVTAFLAIGVLTYVITGGSRWIVVEYLVLVLANAVMFGCELGRHYQMLDNYLATQSQWRRVQQDIRAKLIDDGMPVEQADQTLWQMDLDLERMQRGELP